MKMGGVEGVMALLKQLVRFTIEDGAENHCQ